jgi:hypothetical protein
MELTMEEPTWFQKWSWKTVGWAFVCFLLLSLINGLFSYLFDVLLFEIEIGYAYFYFCIIFFTLILYFFYVKFKSNFFGTFAFGLMGIIGIGIEFWLEYYTNPVLKSPWFAVGWGAIYIMYGLIADASLVLVKYMKAEDMAIIISSIIFSTLILVLTILPLKTFYHTPAIPPAKDYLTYWYFLIPFGIIQGAIGAMAGTYLARKISRKNAKD